jgi:Arc/MetJ-type ribon-helix-helix transcriptional regulator
MIQLVTRVDDSVADAIDALVSSGQFESRSDVVRTSLAELLDSHRRTLIAERILDGYDRIPETNDELAHAAALARAMVFEEPW